MIEENYQRHGCLTAWLILMIVLNGLTALFTPLSATLVRNNLPNFPLWVLGVMTLCALLNVLYAVMLLKWKKWGFYGFCATTAIAFSLNLYAGIGIFRSLLGLLGIIILYILLNIGGERKAWSHMS